MKRLKRIIRFIKSTFIKLNENEGFIVKSYEKNMKDGSFFIYACGSNKFGMYFLISSQENEKSEVHETSFSQSELIELGIINQELLVQECKKQVQENKQQITNKF